MITGSKYLGHLCRLLAHARNSENTIHKQTSTRFLYKLHFRPNYATLCLSRSYCVPGTHHPSKRSSDRVRSKFAPIENPKRAHSDSDLHTDLCLHDNKKVEKVVEPVEEWISETGHRELSQTSESVTIGKIDLLPEDRILTLLFTCKICGKRSARQFSNLSYTKGVVIIQCPGCNKYHLIADNLGWFKFGKNVEEMIKDEGTLERLTYSSLADIPPDLRSLVEEAQAARQKGIKAREERRKNIKK